MLDPTRYWYRDSLSFLTGALLPFSWLFRGVVALRRALYRRGFIKTYHFTAPIIVVGNITVGGTGKTPFVIWLAQFLRSQGFRPGIVSRGVGGKKHHRPYWVKATDSPNEVGDEAILLMQHTNCPVVIGADRVEAVNELLKHTSCNMVISDDGLQHYRLGRKIEIVIMDGKRLLGNGCLLPAGPLREPCSRLSTVDFIVVNGGESLTAFSDSDSMQLLPGEFVSLKNAQAKTAMTAFPHKKVHAVAGIGNPDRFFLSLKNAGFDIIPHAFPDHYLYSAHDLDFQDTLPIVMTEKDAVKCKSFASERYWYLNITVKINDELEKKLLTKLKGVTHEIEEDFSKPSCRHVNALQCDDTRERT